MKIQTYKNKKQTKQTKKPYNSTTIKQPNLKMGRELQLISPERKYTYGQYVQEKIFNITNH